MKVNFKNIIILFICLIFSIATFANKQKTDWKITYNRKDKIPYGAFLAYEAMQKLFPYAKITEQKKLFKYENEFETEPEIDGKQLKFILATQIEFADFEITKLLEFVNNGNYLFISATTIDNEFLNKFNLSTNYENFDTSSKTITTEDDNTIIKKQTFSLKHLKDTSTYLFSNGEYMNKMFKYFETKDDVVNNDEAITSDDETYDHNNNNTKISKSLYDITNLGFDKKDNSNFIMIRYGAGKIFIHCAPLLFTNYFLLQNNNKDYLEKVLSYIPQDVKELKWHQYINRKKEYKNENKNPLLSLLKYPMWAFAIALSFLGIIFYIVFNSKRKQREIPIIPPVKNTSLEFVETIGQLYYNKQNHKNLAEKMIAHLLEKIRLKYNLYTNKLDEDLEIALSKKSGAQLSEVQNLFTQIKTIRNLESITAEQLVALYQTIQQFNQHIS